MEVGVLGPLVIRVGGAPSAPKERALLELLALHARRVVSETALIEGLWGDEAPVSAPQTLHTLISRLRRRVPSLTVERSGAGYRLDVDPDEVDVHRFERLAAAGRVAGATGDYRRSRRQLSDAVALWRGTPLSDLAGPSADAEVVRLEQLLSEVEDELVAARLELGDDVMVGQLEAAVAAQPLRERRWAHLMKALYRNGRRAEALRTFQQARRVLGELTGLEPGPELVALERAIIDDDPTLTAPCPSRTSSGSRRSIPVWATSLIGRGDQRAQVLDHLQRHRAVTLTGIGGVGKTRLAASVAEHLAERSDEDVHFVDLSVVQNSAAVIDAVATALDVPRDPDRTLVEQIESRLGVHDSLLVVDNCESVADGTAALVRQLIDTVPKLRILCTSREPLAVSGEVVERVDPLPLPPSATSDRSVVGASPAVQLFIERARDVDPSFAMSDAAVSDVAAICHRVDGIPLAIELAAAQIDVLGPAQLAERLTGSTDILRNRRRDRSDRHASLDTVLDSTYQLLDPDAQRLLDRLAVFRSPTSIDAIETVTVDDHLPPGAILEALSRLVRRSLVATTFDGRERRYRLLETVRSFAWQHLADNEELDTWRTRHFDWVLATLQRAASGWAREMAAWHRAIEDIVDDVEHALEWAARTPHDAEQAMRSVTGIFSYWGTRRALGARWCRTLAHAATTLEPAQRLETLWNACFLMGGIDLPAAADIAQEARSLAAHAGGDPTSDALAVLATMTCAAFSDDRTALRHNHGRAAPHLDGLPRLFAEYFDMWATSLDGRHDEADQTMRHLLPRVRALGDEHIYSGFLGEAVDLALMTDADGEQLRREAAQALDIALRVPCPLCESKALTSLVLATPSMRPDEAIDHGRQAVRRAHESGLPLAVILAMPVLASSLHAEGSTHQAIRLAAATESLRRRTGHCHLLPARRHRHEHTIDAARRNLGDDRFRQAWTDGADLSYAALIHASITSAPGPTP